MIEPSYFEEAMEDPTWVDAMVEEYDSIVRNNAWEIVPRPEGKSVMGSRWIYKVKQAADWSVEKYKERFFSQGFSQIEGIDYEETFAPVARYSSIRTILALSAQMGWHIHQMDVKTTFLNGVIEEEVYIEQPEGFKEDEVKLCGFTDADWAGSPTDRKSTLGGVFSIGSTTVSWYSRKQRSVALSSTEAKYMAASLAAYEAIWMRKILVGLFGSHLDPTVIYYDNQSCIKLTANLVFHDRSKHIDIRYHHIRNCVQRRIMLLSYIPTED
eukprot:PITA_09127